MVHSANLIHPACDTHENLLIRRWQQGVPMEFDRETWIIDINGDKRRQTDGCTHGAMLTCIICVYNASPVDVGCLFYTACVCNWWRSFVFEHVVVEKIHNKHTQIRNKI